VEPETADYIIAGGGSAGCVLANRLSANPANRVVLLEAGGAPAGFLRDAPAIGMSRLGKPDTDWCYLTEPDPSLNGRQSLWNAGRILGGGSAINGLVYMRGARADYDEWAELGCAGWGWDEVLPYFRKSEDFAGSPGPAHGSGGPLGVGERPMKHPLAEVFVETCRRSGLRRIDDYCSGDTDGAYLVYVAQHGGKRSSSASAFLDEATLRRPNLKVLTGATVDRVLVENGRATGVRFLRDGAAETLHCRREVVVSAGTLQSPAILMRSGVGPAEQLRALGIDVVRDAPQVGRNLQEHASFASMFEVDVPTWNTMMGPVGMARALLTYLLSRKGLMTVAPIEAMAGLRSRPDLAHPDIHLSLGMMIMDHATRKPHARPGVMALASVPKPKSRGEIRLRSADPADRPVIDHRMLGHPDDVATMIAAAKAIQRLFATAPLADHVVAPLWPSPLPTSDDEWEQVIRDTCGSSYRPVGSCRMGADGEAVVDPRLRVRGVEGLRVADVSIMPVILDAGMTAPAMMIAEKAAEMIGEDAKLGDDR
jgi:choline dehydrogenase